MRTIHISKPTLLYYMVALVAMLFTGCSDDFFAAANSMTATASSYRATSTRLP